MPRFMDDELKELLERLHDKYNRPEFIEDDPISVPHRYTDRADREIAGFLAATIAWGNRRAIVTSGHRMMRCMDDAPADFVRNASDRELAISSKMKRKGMTRDEAIRDIYDTATKTNANVNRELGLGGD